MKEWRSLPTKEPWFDQVQAPGIRYARAQHAGVASSCQIGEGLWTGHLYSNEGRAVSRAAEGLTGRSLVCMHPCGLHRVLCDMGTVQ